MRPASRATSCWRYSCARHMAPVFGVSAAVKCVHPMIIKEIAQASPVERKLIEYPTTCDLTAQSKSPARVGRAGLVGLLRCIDYKRLIVADRFVALSAQADKCVVFGRPPLRRMRYLRACPAVTRFAIVFAGRPLGKNHGCCPDAARFNAPKSWADVFHGRPLGKLFVT